MIFLQIIAFLWSNRALIVKLIQIIRDLFDNKDDAKAFLQSVAEDQDKQMIFRAKMQEAKKACE